MQAQTLPDMRLRTIRSSKWFIYTVVNLAVFTDAYVYGLIIPVIPFALAEYVNIPPDNVQTWIGILLGSYGAGLIVGSPVAGYLADNDTSRRGPYMLGLVALIASTGLFSLGNSMAVLVIARLIQGTSAGFVHSIGVAILADTVGKEAIGKAMGFVSLMIAAGMVIGPACGGALYHRFGYGAVFASAYALIGLDLLFRVLMVDQKPAAEGTTPTGDPPYGPRQSDGLAGQGYGTFEPECESQSVKGLPNMPDECDPCCGSASLRMATETHSSNPGSSSMSKHLPSQPTFVILLSRPRMLAAILGALMVAFMLTELESVLPLYIKRLFNFNSQDVGLIFLVVMLGYFNAPFIGALSDRIGAKVTVTAGYVLLTPLWTLLRLVNHNSSEQVALLFVLLTAVGIALNLILSPVFTEAKHAVDEVQEERPGVFGEKSAYAMAFALMNMAYAVGSLLGPVLGSFLVKRIGWANSTLLVGILCALCTLPSFYAVGGRIQQKSVDSDTDA